MMVGRLAASMNPYAHSIRRGLPLSRKCDGGEDILDPRRNPRPCPVEYYEIDFGFQYQVKLGEDECKGAYGAGQPVGECLRFEYEPEEIPFQRNAVPQFEDRDDHQRDRCRIVQHAGIRTIAENHVQDRKYHQRDQQRNEARCHFLPGEHPV